MEIYKRIKIRREELGMSQEELAKKLGYKSRSSINKIETGENDIPQSKISSFAKALLVTEAWLMGFDNPYNYSHKGHVSSDTIWFEITARSLKYSPEIYQNFCDSLKDIFSQSAVSPITSGKYTYANIYEVFISAETSFEKKAAILNSIVDFAIYDIKTKVLSIYYSTDTNEIDQALKNIEFNCQKLNLQGLEKVNNYISDIASIPSYVHDNAYSKVKHKKRQ